MDDGFLSWPKNENIDVFIDIFFLDELHPSLKFTIGKGKSSCKQNFDTFVQALIFFRCFYYFTPTWSVRN